MRIVVDDVGLEDQESARTLEHHLLELSEIGHDIVVLARGRALDFERCKVFPFPSYEPDRVNAADSEMLQRYCDKLGADIFMTTGSTTPLTTPGVMLAGAVSTSAATLREREERRLCSKYCHAIVGIFGKESDGDGPSHQNANKQAETLEDALSRSVYPRAFYDEWARLRRLQNKLDVKLWSDYPRLGA